MPLKDHDAKLAYQREWRRKNNETYNAKRRKQYAEDGVTRQQSIERAARWRAEHPTEPKPRQPKPKPPSDPGTLIDSVTTLVTGKTFEERMVEYRKIYEEARERA